MSGSLSFPYRDKHSVPVTCLSSVSQEKARLAIDSEVFRTWIKRCESTKDGKRIDMHSVEIQHIDMFGSRVGFMKIRADCVLVDETTKNEHSLPGICFLRGASVGILIALVCENDIFSVLVQQPRVPIGDVACLELPAGMIDKEEDGVAGTAAREIEEECGIHLQASELIDLTEHAFTKSNEQASNLIAGIAPSPGGSDEYIRYMYTERRVSKGELEKMKGRLAGLHKEGEFITLRIVPLADLWKVSADNKAICALFLLDQLRKDGMLPPVGGLLPDVKDPILRLSDNRIIPSLAFGLYKVPKGQEGESIILNAVAAGYRHFDTASLYNNESELGRAIRQSGLPRENFFIASKVWNDDQKRGPQAVRDSVQKSLRNLSLAYIDIIYIHWPVPGCFVETYQVLQDFVLDGLVRNIGLSNFGILDFETLMKNENIKVLPAVNQIEVSPFMYRPKVIDFFQDQGMIVVASKSLHRFVGGDHDTVKKIGKKYNASPAQILIRWGLQKKLVVITKTSHQHRMLENRDVLSFSLTHEEIHKLDSLTSEKDIQSRDELERHRKGGV